MTFAVLRNDKQTHTTMMPIDEITDEDRIAYDGSEKKVVHVFEAHTHEIADILFEIWCEREERDRPHTVNCWSGEDDGCWCHGE